MDTQLSHELFRLTLEVGALLIVFGVAVIRIEGFFRKD